MISSLSIQNYALIRELQIDPDAGLNIVTGETGAGKSIMLGAVGLLLGNRADTKVLLDKDKKCIVEGVFKLGPLDLRSLFEQEDVDYEDESIIRREISPAGKSRAFVNDQPVTLDVLKTISTRLIDIHSQNESIQLGDKSVKIKIVDDYAQSGELLSGYQAEFKHYQDVASELTRLENKSSAAKQDADYKKFLLDELVKSELKKGELEELEEELSVLENAEEIKLKLSQITAEFDGVDMSLNDRMREASQTLLKLSGFSKELAHLAERFESASMEMFDVIGEMASEQDKIEYDPERIDQVNKRLDLINRLLQKHQVSTVDELLSIQSGLENESEEADDLEDRLKQLRLELDQSKKCVISTAEALSEVRRVHIDKLSASLNHLLGDVGMSDGHVEITYRRVEPWKLGIDEVELLFSANKGIRPEPVAKVASGGEFSRLMFCLKFLLAQKTAMPTVIFDEIDTGVSGEIAIKMAVMMKKMSANHQIISISHLPQIAAKGDAHYFVYKDNQASTAQSLIKKLEGNDRLDEIAKMIGGERPSDTARESARELIGNV